MTTKTITILAGRAAEARARVKKLDKKALKYGVEFAATFGPVYQEERAIGGDDGTPEGAARREHRVMVDVLDVTITGSTPKVGEFEFLASIELTANGNFVDSVPGVELDPKYRTTDSRCEHCKKTRGRKHVYAVRNLETGTELQVGRTCLRDFLGIDDPEKIINQFKFWRLLDAGGDEDGFESYGRAEWSASLEYLLAMTNACIRIWGWASKGAAEASYGKMTPTIEMLWCLYNSDEGSRAVAREIRDEVRESDDALAREVIEWVRGSTGDSDYMHNLRVAFADDMLITTRRTALAISPVATLHRAKERLKGLQLTFESSRSMGDNGWGPTKLLKFKDIVGNQFCWFTGSSPRMEIGQRMICDGTVKAHKDFHGILETQLTRVTVKEILDA